MSRVNVYLEKGTTMSRTPRPQPLGTIYKTIISLVQAQEKWQTISVGFQYGGFWVIGRCASMNTCAFLPPDIYSQTLPAYKDLLPRLASPCTVHNKHDEVPSCSDAVVTESHLIPASLYMSLFLSLLHYPTGPHQGSRSQPALAAATLPTQSVAMSPKCGHHMRSS